MHTQNTHTHMHKQMTELPNEHENKHNTHTHIGSCAFPHPRSVQQIGRTMAALTFISDLELLEKPKLVLGQDYPESCRRVIK